MRTFIALDLSPEIKKQLAALVVRLQPFGRGVKWVSRDSMHLTLKFLGEVDEKKAAEVTGLVRSVAARHAPFRLACRGTGTFPAGSRSPRVLWVGIEADPGLGLLQDDLECGCETLGFARESRPFRPHLTLGRVKSPGGMGPLLKELEARRGDDLGEMLVREITFFRSQLRPGGAEYSVLGEFPLP